MLTEGFKDLAGREKGWDSCVGRRYDRARSIPIWVKFARALMAMMAMPAQ